MMSLLQRGWWQAGAGVVGSKEDARLREVIEGEVLDTRPSVRWKDIAGLAAAKQARLCIASLDCGRLTQEQSCRPQLCHVTA